MIFDPQRPKLRRAVLRSASWLPVYLIGMGVISWLGQYSGQSTTTPLAPTNTNTIGLWYDLLVVAAFSLVIYFWAVAVRLPREDDAGAGHASSPGKRTCLPPTLLVAKAPHRYEGPRSAQERGPSASGEARLVRSDSRQLPAATDRPVAEQHPRHDLLRAAPGRSGRCRPRPRPGCPRPATSPPGLPFSHQATRLTSRKPGRCGCHASTTWPGRTRRVRQASSQSPGRSAGTIECSATATRMTGQRFGRARTFTSTRAE